MQVSEGKRGRFENKNRMGGGKEGGELTYVLRQIGNERDNIL